MLDNENQKRVIPLRKLAQFHPKPHTLCFYVS